MRRVIFNINGGVGRCLCFTGVIKRFKELNPDVEINVLTSFPDIFMHNPNIERVYPFNTPYMFEDVISKMEYYEPEPYRMHEYYSGNKHMIECFNKEVNGLDEMVTPDVYFTDKEIEDAKKFASQQKNPIVLIQPFGSMGGRGQADESMRSLKPEFAEKLIRKLQEKYSVFIVKDDKQLGFKDLQFLTGSSRAIMAILPMVKGIVCVDSFLQHAAYAMDKKAFVFWTTTRESNLGYKLHENVRNGKEFFWSPIRMLSNNQDLFKKNKGIDTFDDTYIDRALAYVEAQTVTTPEPFVACGTCK